MGTKSAPALATIYLGQFKETLIASRALMSNVWLRYIDDIFVIWTHLLKELHTFLADVKGVQPRIKLTAEILQRDGNFVDLTIYMSPSINETGPLCTRTCYKTTNTFCIPFNTSYIQAHIFKGIAIGEMTRMIQAPRHQAYAQSIKEIL